MLDGLGHLPGRDVFHVEIEKAAVVPRAEHGGRPHGVHIEMLLFEKLALEPLVVGKAGGLFPDEGVAPRLAEHDPAP